MEGVTTKAKIMNIADIIIVNYNSTNCLLKCLESINKNRDNCVGNVLVFDNGSMDNFQRAMDLYPHFSYYDNKKNIGFSAAVNRGLKESESSYIVLLNPDTYIKNGLIEKSLRYMEKNTDIGIIGPKIFETDGSVQGSARSFPTPLTALFGRKSPITRLFPNNPITKKDILVNNSTGDSPFYVDWVSGACMIIRREAIDAIGGFDEKFFLYWEDTDLCKRIRDKGWQVCYFPKAQITHTTGQSSSKRPISSIYHFHRSCYYLFMKHSRMPMRIIAPIAFFGLALRASLVIIINILGRFIEVKREKTDKKARSKIDRY